MKINGPTMIKLKEILKEESLEWCKSLSKTYREIVDQYLKINKTPPQKEWFKYLVINEHIQKIENQKI